MGKSFEEEMWSLHFDPPPPKGFFQRHKTRLQVWGLISIILFILFSPFLFIVGYFAYDSAKDWWNRVPFDSAKWQDKALIKSQQIRSRMVVNLFEKHQLKGMKREEIITLLGEPDDVSAYGDWSLRYCLWSERGWVLSELEFLVFRLDEHQRVAEYKIISG